MRVAYAALLLAGCTSFDKSLIDYASVTPHDGPTLHDAGHGSEPNENPPHEMQGSGGRSAHDAGAIGGGLDASQHMPPPSDVDAGHDDDAGRDDAGHPITCEPSQVSDYCLHVPALVAAPVIDGALDCGAPLLAVDPIAWNGTAPMPPDHVTKLALATRADGLYVYVEVHGAAPRPHPSGSEIYCGDAVELYVDAMVPSMSPAHTTSRARCRSSSRLRPRRARRSTPCATCRVPATPPGSRRR